MKILRKHLEGWYRNKDVEKYLHLQKESRKKLKKEYMKMHQIRKVQSQREDSIESYCKRIQREERVKESKEVDQ